MAVQTDELSRQPTTSGPAPYPRHDRGTESDDPSEIRAHIERTRAEMGTLIDEIQERLSPEKLKQQTQEAIRDATLGKVEQMANRAEYKVNNWRSSAMRTAKENPVPLALIGIGLGWLVMSERNGDDYDYDYEYRRGRYAAVPGGRRYSYVPAGEPYTYYDYEDEGRERSRFEEAQARAGEMVDATRERAGETVAEARDRAEDAARRARETVGEAGSQVREQASVTAQEAQMRAERLAYEARMRARQAKRTFWDTMNENPLAVGAAALALGAVVGMAIPSTATENELMGEKRDQLLEEAKHTAEDAARRAQTVAKKAQEAAVDEAKREAERQELTEPSL